MVYATNLDYLKLYDDLPDDFTKLAERVSRIIDTLTYNRIVRQGFNNLTEYQRKTVIECCCEIVQFYEENGDMLDTVFNSYSINGVSMQFDFKAAVSEKSGVIIRTSTYSRLMSTGLCYGGLI